MPVKEKETLKKYLMEGIAFNKNDMPKRKMTIEEEQSQDWHRDNRCRWPYYKFGRQFYFGGLKKDMKIPISMPDRVIVEPNPPRQGYSNLTWSGLNEYYLQNAIDQSEYEEILQKCKKIAFQVYAINREENRFLQDTMFAKLSNVVWAFCIISIITLIYYELIEEKFTQWGQNIVILIFSISMVLITIMTFVNWMQKPPLNIFLNYEKFLRQSIQKQFASLNVAYKAKNGVQFLVAENDICWLEILIPKALQMPYSEFQIKRHIDVLNLKARKECPEDPNTIKLYEVVATQKEADEHNANLDAEQSLELEVVEPYNCERDTPQMKSESSTSDQDEELSYRADGESPQKMPQKVKQQKGTGEIELKKLKQSDTVDILKML